MLRIMLTKLKNHLKWSRILAEPSTYLDETETKG